MYMNRLLSGPENLILGKKKKNTQLAINAPLPDHYNKQLNTNLLSSVSFDKKEDLESIDMISDLDKDIIDYKPTKIDQAVQVTTLKDDAVMELFKKHLVEVICRITPYQREKTDALVAQLQGERLESYMLRGVQKEGKDITAMEYLTYILDLVKKRIKHIPPFKRRIVEMRTLLTEAAKEEKSVQRTCDCNPTSKNGNPKRHTVFKQFSGSFLDESCKYDINSPNQIGNSMQVHIRNMSELPKHETE